MKSQNDKLFQDQHGGQGKVEKIFIVYDTETTGIDPAVHQILSADFLALDESGRPLVDEKGNDISEKSVRFAFKGDHVPSLEASVVTGINPFEHKGFSEKKATAEILSYVKTIEEKFPGKEVWLVGHNPDFDRKFLRAATRRGGHGYPKLPKQIDTAQLTAMAFHSGLLKNENLEYSELRGQKVPSFSVASVAKSFGLCFDKQSLHSSKADTLITSKILFSLKDVLGERIFTSYPKSRELEEAFRLKVVEMKFVDPFTKNVSAKKLFFTGHGAESRTSDYGIHKFDKTICLDLSKIDVEASVLTDSDIEEASYEFDARKHPTILSLDIVDTPDILLGKEKEIAKVVVETISQRRTKYIENEVRSITGEASTESVKASGVRGFFPYAMEAQIEFLANVLESKGEAEFLRYLEQNFPENGHYWRSDITKKAKSFLFRERGLYKDHVLSELKKQIPEQLALAVKEITVDKLSGPSQKKLVAKGVGAIRLTSDGFAVTIEAKDATGRLEMMDVISISSASIGSSRASFPLADDINERLISLFDLNKTQADLVRRNFSVSSDNSSFKAVQRDVSRYLTEKTDLTDDTKKCLDAIKNTLNCSYDEFLNRLTRHSLLDEQSALGSKYAPKSKKMDASILKAAFTASNGKASKLKEGSLSYIEILRTNVSDPRFALEERVDELGGTHKYLRDVRASERKSSEENTSTQHSDHDDGGADSGDSYVAIKCKVCKKMVSMKNAVSGMGATCAKNLSEWLKNPTFVQSSLMGRKGSLADFKDGDDFPIMLVENKKTKEIFATDVLKKLEDGRYMAIDLTSIVKNQDDGGEQKPSHVKHAKDIMNIFLDDDNYSVIATYSDLKKTS